MSDNKFCEKCGNRIQEEEKFCSRCGASTVSKEKPIASEIDDKKQSNNRLKVVVLSFVITIVAIIAVAAFLLLQQQQTNNVDEASVVEEPVVADEDQENSEVPAESEVDEESEISEEKGDDEVEPIVEENLADEYILPDSDSKIYTADELLALSVEDLRIARNEIYARHGVIFESDDLATHFNNTSWYEPSGVLAAEFDDSILNSYELQNIENILGAEFEPVDFIGQTMKYIEVDYGRSMFDIEVNHQSGKIQVYYSDSYTINSNDYTYANYGEGYATSKDTCVITFRNADVYGDGDVTLTLRWSSEYGFVVEEREGVFATNTDDYDSEPGKTYTINAG